MEIFQVSETFILFNICCRKHTELTSCPRTHDINVQQVINVYLSEEKRKKGKGKKEEKE